MIPFAGGDNNKSIAETKSAAASRLIVDFFDSRTDDMVGVITFSNSAMFILPLTNNKEAIRAAVKCHRWECLVSNKYCCRSH